jgi:hypothetical protein
MATTAGVFHRHGSLITELYLSVNLAIPAPRNQSLLGRNVGGALESEVARSYNSFSGSDIRCVIGQYQFAELQAVSYSVTREKAPIYTLGSPDVRSFSRNKRGIAGTLIWINFDRHGLLNLVI